MRKRRILNLLGIILCFGLLLCGTGIYQAYAADINNVDELGPYIHYNGFIFNYFESESADIEGALAVGKESKIGTSGQYDVGASAAPAYSYVSMGKYKNEKSYPTLLLNHAPVVGRNGSNNIHVYGGPLVLNENMKSAYESGNKISGTTKYSEGAMTDQYFDQAQADTKDLVDVINNANKQDDSFITNNQLCGWASNFHNIQESSLNPDNVDIDPALGIDKEKILVVNVTDSGHVSINEPRIQNKHGGYELIVFNYRNASSVTFTGGSLTVIDGGGQINTSAPGYWYPAENARLEKYAEKVIWNFPKAESVKVSSCGVVGSVLAPYARLDANGGSINGMLIADSFTTKGGMELHAFKMKNIFRVLSKNDIKGNVKLTKIDADDKMKLEGAEFRLEYWNGTEWRVYLEGDNDYSHLSTDQNGIIEIKDLPEGKYRLTELDAPDGYDLEENSWYEFEINKEKDGQTIELTAENSKKPKAEMDLVKVDSSDSSQKLDGAKFELFRYENGKYTKDGMVSYGSEGKVRLSELTEGIYYLVEMQAPDGYFSTDAEDSLQIRVAREKGSKELTVEYSWDGDNYTVYEKEDKVFIPNTKIPGGELPGLDPVTQIILRKTDANTGKGLDGAEFVLEKYDGTKWNPFPELPESNLIEVSHGVAVIEDLTDGRYRLREQKAPDGYVADTEETEFWVQDQKVSLQQNGSTVTEVEVSNTPIAADIKIRKANIAGSSGLAGAIFELYEDLGFRELKFIDRFETKDNGFVEIKDLPMGRYVVEEVSPPEGYDLQRPYVIRFSVDENGDVISEEGDYKNGALEFNNDTLKGNVVLLKRAEVTEENQTEVPLGDIKFNLYMKNERGAGSSWRLMSSEVTGTDGRIEIKGLELGTYKLVEMENPHEEYEFAAGEDAYEVIFVVSAEDLEHEIVMENMLKETEPTVDLTLKKIDEETYEELYGAVFELSRKTDDPQNPWEIVDGNIKTGDDGCASVEGLAAGSYQFKELQAPQGYTIVDKDKEFLVTFDIVNEEGELLIKNVNADGIDLSKLQMSRMGNVITLTNREDPTIPDFKIYKVDEDDRDVHLVGAEFDLYKKDSETGEFYFYSKVETNYDGRLIFPELKEGDYYFTEEQSPEGYEAKEKEYHFTVKKENGSFRVEFEGAPLPENKEIHITNKRDKTVPFGEITIKKRDFNDPDLTLKGAEFTLYRSDDGKEGSYLVYQKVFSGDDGTVEMPQLAEGYYQLKETKAPDEYEISNKVFEFYVAEEEGELKAYYQGMEIRSEEEKELIIYDAKKQERQPIEFPVYKVDGDDPDTYLAGAKFQLSYKAGETDREYEWSDIIVSGNNGEILLQQLQEGFYRLEEMEAPSGYEKTGKVFEFYVEEVDSKLTAFYNGREIAEDSSQKLVIKNYKEENAEPVDLKLKKVSYTDENAVLEGAEFYLYHNSLDGSGTEVIYGHMASDSSGVILLPQLIEGSYRLAEIKAPDGYELTNKEFRFEIREVNNKLVGYYKGQKITQEEEIEFKIYNLKEAEAVKPVGAVLYKVDGDDGSRLAGAKFQVRYSDVKDGAYRLVDYAESDTEGRVYLEDLRKGYYQIIETQAPDKYSLMDGIYELQVRDGSDGQLEVVYDQRYSDKIPNMINEEYEADTDLKLRKVDADSKDKVLAGAVFTLYKYDSAADEYKDTGRSTTTNRNGETVLSGLTAGRYQLIEKKAPDGYTLSQEPVEFELKLNSKDELELWMENKKEKESEILIVIENHLTETLKGSVKINKAEYGNAENLLPGAVFELYHRQENEEEPDLADPASSDVKEEEKKEEQDSDENVTQTEDEKEAEMPDQEEQEQDTAGESPSDENNKPEADVAENVAGMVQNNQSDSEDEWEFVGEYMTDNHGYVFLKDLEAGSYKFIEKEAPEGFIKEDREFLFEIEEKGGALTAEPSEITVLNEKKKTTDPDPDPDPGSDPDPDPGPDPNPNPNPDPDGEKPGGDDGGDTAVKVSKKTYGSKAGNSAGKAAYTGDKNNMWLYVVFMAVCAGIVVIYFVRKLKKEE